MILNILFYTSIFVFGMMVLALSDIAIYVQLNEIKLKNFRKVFLIPLFKKKKFPLKYVLIMLSGGVMAEICYFQFSNKKNMVICLAFYGILMAVSIVDIYKMEIPNGFWIAVAILGIIAAIFIKDITLSDRLIGFFAASIPLFLIALLVPGGFGGGDIKLMAASGILLGWKLVLVATFVGIIIGGIYGIIALIRKKKGGKDHFAFGPCLSIGMIATLLFESKIVDFIFQYLDFSKYM